MDKLAVFNRIIPGMSRIEAADKMAAIINKVLRHPWKAVSDEVYQVTIVLVDESIPLTPELVEERSRIIKAIMAETGAIPTGSSRVYE